MASELVLHPKEREMIERERQRFMEMEQMDRQGRFERSVSGLSAMLRSERSSMGLAQMMMNGRWDQLSPLPIHVPDKPSTQMLATMEIPELAGTGRQALAVEVEDLLGYTALRKDAGAPSKLQRILVELEIEAFDQKTVDAYKQKMQLHFQAIAANKDRKGNPSGNDWMYPVTEVSWSLIKLEAYTKPVPEFVLRKCVDIKRKAPDATFFVDELREEKRTLDPFLIVKIGNDSAAIEVWDEPEFEKAL